MYFTLTEEDDWNDVITECSSLAAKWKEISGYLGLSFKLIDIIEGNNLIGCWNEALKEWIQQNFRTEKFGVPSWSLLKAVARVDMLQFRKLANSHQGIAIKVLLFQSPSEQSTAYRVMFMSSGYLVSINVQPS